MASPGDLVYVLTADSVKAINSFHHIIASFPIAAEPKQMMISSDGSRIYVTGYDASLSIIDPIARTTKTVVKQRSTAAAVSPDGKFIYLAHGGGVGDRGTAFISTVRADGISVGFVAVDRCTTAMALSPSGHRLFVASAVPRSEGSGGIIRVIDTASHRTVDMLAVDEARIPSRLTPKASSTSPTTTPTPSQWWTLGQNAVLPSPFTMPLWKWWPGRRANSYTRRTRTLSRRSILRPRQPKALL